MSLANEESAIRRKDELRRIVQDQGIRAGLIYLNRLTTHRFSALYRFDGNMLKNLFFHDKENPAQESAPEIPVLASYCVFVRDSGRQFSVENSIIDERVADHPKKLEIKSYCGVPLLDRFGRMLGTMCHFDVEPNRATSPEDIELMEEMANLVEEKLPV